MQGCEKKENEGEQEGKVYGGGQEVGASTLQSEKGLRFQIYITCNVLLLSCYYNLGDDFVTVTCSSRC